MAAAQPASKQQYHQLHTQYYPLSPPMSPPSAESGGSTQFAVRPIPPYRSSTNSSSVSSALLDPSTAPTSSSSAASLSSSITQGLPLPSASASASAASSASGRARPTGGRDRRQSQASTGSADSRRNSGQQLFYPAMSSSPPPPPASSPTYAQAQFVGAPGSSPSLAATTALAGGPAPSEPGRTTVGPGTIPTTSTSSTTTTNNSTNHLHLSARPGHSARRENNSSSGGGNSGSSSAALLYGIEAAQLQIPPFRGGAGANTRANSRRDNVSSPLAPSSSSAGASHRYQQQQQQQQQQQYASGAGSGGVTGPTHRIPATHQTQHRPASTTVVPVQTQQQQQHPQYLYPYTPDLGASQSSGSAAQLSQSTRAPVITSAHTTSSAHHQHHPAAAAGAASRNRASHQIVPVSGPGGHAGSAHHHPGANPVSIALHTAQYANPNRPKLFFGNYQLLHTLGEGEFGKVKLGVHAQRWGEEVAIKLIKKGSIDNAARHIKVQREIDVLNAVRHPHIVRLHEVVETDKYIGIVLEYASGGELFEYILAHKHLRENMACKLFAQLISGVAYLHSKKIVHRDLKLENLLLDRNRNIIITDFGFANRFSDTGTDLMATSCGSPCYAAPELVLQEGSYVGPTVDVWSCGVILYAMLSGYLPYDDDPANPDGDNINLLYRYIISTKLSFPDWISPEPRELLSLMLVPDPTRRCSLRDVMRHSWLRRYGAFFQMSVAELERQAEGVYEEKKNLLERQQMEYLRSIGQLPPAAMARSMSTPGVHDSTAQARHRSAMVTSTTMALTPEMPSPGRPSHIPAPAAGAASPRAHGHGHAQQGPPTPVASPLQEQPRFINPFAVPTASSASPALPTIEPSTSLLASVPMGPSASAPGEVETFSDSVTSEGEMRGEPRSRRGDDDDAVSTTSSSRKAPSSSAGQSRSSRPATTTILPVSSPSPSSSSAIAPASPASGSEKKRKGEEKRYTVQLEYTSPAPPTPSENTRSKAKKRESLMQSPVPPSAEHAAELPSSSSTASNLARRAELDPDATPKKARPALDQQAFVDPQDPTLPILESAAAAETMDVHMQSPNASPAHSVRMANVSSDSAEKSEDMVVERAVTPIPVSAIPSVSPVHEDAEQTFEAVVVPSIQQHTPPSSPSLALNSAADRTPRGPTAVDVVSTGDSLAPSSAAMGADSASLRASSTGSGSPRMSAVPFPSPKQERRPSATPLDRQDSGRENVRPAMVSKTSSRHKKGLSTDRAFFSRLLGSSTTSIDKTDATGQASRSRHSSIIADSRGLAQSQSGMKPSSSMVSNLDEAGKKGNRRRKALSLVVDPFSRSTTNSSLAASASGQSTPAASAAANAKNRRSARVQTSAGTTSSTESRSSVLSSSVQTNGRSNMPVSPSLSSVPSARQSHFTGTPSQIPQPVGYGHASEPSKSKRVSDWFRWKSVARESGSQTSTIVPPAPIQTDFDRRQQQQQPPPSQSSQVKRNSSLRQSTRQQSATRPTVVVTATSPAQIVEEGPSKQEQAQQRVVATPADARNFVAPQPHPQQQQSRPATRQQRSEPSSGAAANVPFDEGKLKMHSGATDRRIVTKTSPPFIMDEVRKVLNGMGMDVVKEHDFRYKVTRKSRKQVAALVGGSSSMAMSMTRSSSIGGLAPSPSSTFRSFFGGGRKNSASPGSLIGNSPSLIAMPSPALSVSGSIAEEGGSGSVESAALSPTISNTSTMQQHLSIPFYGSNNVANADTGGEVKFTVEVVRVKNLTGLYTLDMRRVRGHLNDYREIHEPFVARLNLGSAT